MALIDRGDFASFTSQESSNLVWGGFRYLENYEFGLVRHLCMSRNRLLRAYPSNIAQIGFLASFDQTAPFSPRLAGLGAFGYWAIGNFATQRPRLLSAAQINELEPAVDIRSISGGIEYFDALLKDNDSRFVFSFIRSAIDAGATAANYVEMVSSHRADGCWQLTCLDQVTGTTLRCGARYVVNAAGPFVDGLNSALDTRGRHRVVYSKGIHLVVPRLTEHQRVLAFFDETERLFYVIPMGDRSVVGTTDTRVDSPRTHVTADDRDFLIRQINRLLALDTPLEASDVIAERCGVRPLVVAADGDDMTSVDWTSLSRRHEIEADRERGVVSIYGGKLTDCLNVGEEVAAAVQQLGLRLDRQDSKWFGEDPPQVRHQFLRYARLNGLDTPSHGATGEPLAERLWRRYGHRAFALLEEIRLDPSLARPVIDGHDLRLIEVHHAARTEMVVHLEDFLRRRTDIGLVTSPEQLRTSPGVHDIARLFFGDRAETEIRNYFSPLTTGAPVPGGDRVGHG